jgi:peptidyl-prolyl cis-trans isomerase B (cyclophilin B)
MRNLTSALTAACALFALAACDEITVTSNPQDSKPAAESKPAAKSDPALDEIDKMIASKKVDTSKNGWKLSVPKPEKVTSWAKDKSYSWNLKTNKGDIKIKLMPDVAPMHVTSTAYLTKLGFYDGLTFHRVIPGFMAQGGDPEGRGTGGPGYKYDGEFAASARHTKRGTLSMAHAGPGTDGSQFFLTFGPTPHLDNRHTVFGVMSDGETALAALERAGSQGGATSERLFIEKATIVVE